MLLAVAHTTQIVRHLMKHLDFQYTELLLEIVLGSYLKKN